jgi:hypothetical protein
VWWTINSLGMSAELRPHRHTARAPSGFGRENAIETVHEFVRPNNSRVPIRPWHRTGLAAQGT